MKKRTTVWSAVLAAALACAPAGVAAAGPSQSASHVAHKSGDAREAAKELKDAKLVINRMKMDTHVMDLLKESKGVLLVPNYGRGALVVGGSGGEGVLLAHYHGDWSDPVFYDIGSISIGAQAGVTAGRIAIILMTDKAVSRFKEPNSFSLNANAGLTVGNYSSGEQASAGRADVVFWSDTKGLFAGASVGASTISADESANRAFYGARYASPRSILSGVSERRPDAAALRHDLPA